MFKVHEFHLNDGLSSEGCGYVKAVLLLKLVDVIGLYKEEMSNSLRMSYHPTLEH